MAKNDKRPNCAECEHKCNELAVVENEIEHLKKHAESCTGKHVLTAKELEEIRLCQAKTGIILTPKLARNLVIIGIVIGGGVIYFILSSGLSLASLSQGAAQIKPLIELLKFL